MTREDAERLEELRELERVIGDQGRPMSARRVLLRIIDELEAELKAAIGNELDILATFAKNTTLVDKLNDQRVRELEAENKKMRDFIAGVANGQIQMVDSTEIAFDEALARIFSKPKPS